MKRHWQVLIFLVSVVMAVLIVWSAMPLVAVGNLSTLAFGPALALYTVAALTLLIYIRHRTSEGGWRTVINLALALSIYVIFWAHSLVVGTGPVEGLYILLVLFETWFLFFGLIYPRLIRRFPDKRSILETPKPTPDIHSGDG